ncbi:MAG: hypothetical protein ACOX9B_06650 [Candidatus Xenobium sp.]|jgi:hypothetical protein|nr:hypothetical protein [Burkholderiales bacterium]
MMATFCLPVLNMLKDRDFWRYFLVALIFFGALAPIQFVAEAYSFYGGGMHTAPALYVTHGRFIPAVEWWAFKASGLPDPVFHAWSHLAVLFCTATSLFVLDRALRRECLEANRMLLAPVAVLILVNPFMLDLVLWTQKSTHMLSVLACTLAFSAFLPVLEGRPGALLQTWGWLLVANFAYQGPLALFPCLALFVICAKPLNWRTWLCNHAWTALAFGLPTLISYLTLRFLLDHQRVSQPLVWHENLQSVRAGLTEALFNSFGLLPANFFLAFLGLITLLVILAVLVVPPPQATDARQAWNVRFWELLTVPYLLAGGLAMAMAPHMFVASDIIWVVPRNIYAMGCLPGLMLAWLLARREIRGPKAWFLAVCVVLFVGLVQVRFQTILHDHYTMNRRDQEIALKIRDLVRAHERASGVQVTRMALYFDRSTRINYPGLFWNRDTNMRALGFEEGTVDILHYITDLDLKLVPPSRTIQDEFSKLEWNDFSPEQLKFEGDTLHLCLF